MKTNPDFLPSTPAVLLPYCRDCRDLSEWPEHWMGEEKDLRRLIEYFMPFLLHLAGEPADTARSSVARRPVRRRHDPPRTVGRP